MRRLRRFGFNRIKDLISFQRQSAFLTAEGGLCFVTGRCIV